MFQCPHDCFVEKIEETDEGSGDTIEEMDEEEDVDSIRQLVNQGLDVGTDCMTDRLENIKHFKTLKPDNFYMTF